MPTLAKARNLLFIQTTCSCIPDQPRREDVVLKPRTESMFAGEIVTCSAKGNPKPQVSLGLADRHSSVEWSKGSHGVGRVDLPVPKTAEEGNFTFVCTAWNDVGAAEKERKIEIRSKSKFLSRTQGLRRQGTERCRVAVA